MKRSFLGLLSATSLVILAVFSRGGWSLVGQGFSAALSTLLQALPLLVVAFIVTGQMQVLISLEWIDRLWGRLTGVKGILISSIAGGLFPGPPYVYYPFISTFKNRPIPSYMFFSFVAGKQVYDLLRLPMEISLINPLIALLRNLITLPVPLLMGLIFKRFISQKTTARFFGERGI